MYAVVKNLVESNKRNMRINTPRMEETSRTKKRDRNMITESVQIYANLPKNMRELWLKKFIDH